TTLKRPKRMRIILSVRNPTRQRECISASTFDLHQPTSGLDRRILLHKPQSSLRNTADKHGRQSRNASHRLIPFMNTPLSEKSSPEAIRQRFDADVERFSNLETGQSATIDAPLAMELITHAARAATPEINRILDIGCGAGNNSIRLIRTCKHDIDCDLCDLSRPMLDRAMLRVSAETKGVIRLFEGDFRSIPLEESSYDVILAAAVLHHLRDADDWESAFRKIHYLLKPGGSIWITDLVTHEHPSVHTLMWKRYGDYLEGIGGPDYRQTVFDYIDKEDSPRSLTFQLELMRRVGFRTVDILHKNSCFAAFGAIK
ncbi:MAG: class I SAM-dependent methyltransferase, partial [Opitutales bacterium]|nr:class I SAM-dependent methyltransferase [Opitutales bacterium]